MAFPSSQVSAEAAIGEPDRTRQAPSQPTPRVLHGLSVNTEPSRAGMSAWAPAFMIPRAVTNRPSPTMSAPILFAARWMRSGPR